MRKIKVKNFFIFIILNIFIFQDFLQKNFSIFQSFDELIAICFGLYYIFSLKCKINKREFYIILISIILIIIGAMGTFRYSYQTNINSILLDIFCFFKYIITFLGAMKMFKKNFEFEKIINVEVKLISILTIITFIFMILNFFKGINSMTYEVRYGIRSFQFIYGHAGTLNVVTTYCCMFLIGKLFLNTTKNKLLYHIMIILNLIILLSTLRTRAWITIALIELLIYVYYIKKKEKINKKVIIPICFVLIFLLGYEQFDNYFISSDRTPRSDLIRYGVTLMTESFPTGTGFATFGSYAASKYYSILYYRFGFQNNFGMRPDQSQYLTDNFWPIVIAQYGFFGIVLYIALLYNLYKYIWSCSDNKMKKMISLLIILVILINSTASSSFVHYTAVAYMFILSLFLNCRRDVKSLNERTK